MNTNQEFATVRQVSLPMGATATHEARSGKSYTMSKDKPCYMPMEDAYTFLVDAKAFQVRSAVRTKNQEHDEADERSEAFIYNEGDIITAGSNKKVEDGRVNLDEDEIVAKLDELTNVALLKRCKRLDGSESMNKGTKKNDLIAFLVKNKPQAIVGQGRGSEGAPPEMPKESLDNLLELNVPGS